jgi:hypothetical protein
MKSVPVGLGLFNEKAEPWKLAPYQRRVLELALKRKPNGALVYRQIIISDVKKSGKTFLSASLVGRHHAQ